MPTKRWFWTMLVAVAAAAFPIVAGAGKADATGPVLAGAQPAGSAGVWGTATRVPGTDVFPQAAGSGWVTSVSCARPGDCSAGGAYPDSQGLDRAFVASEVNGTWHTAINILGAALNPRHLGWVNSVSCAKPGDCSAGGYYTDSAGNNQAFVVNEVNGTWHTAIEVPGTAALNRIGDATVDSVSCASPGNCSAGGSYEGVYPYVGEAFVASEVNGTWHTAIEVPGTAALNAYRSASVNSVSCNSRGDCSAGGSYWDLQSKQQAFVVNEVNGTWHAAIEVPGTAALNQGGTAKVASLSCGSAGNCAAGGFYSDVYGQQQAFVVNEVNGTWRTAIEVPGTAALNKADYGGVTSVSCPTAGNCSAGGHYSVGTGFPSAFVANEVNGTWRTAIAVPGTGTTNSNVNSVSCASAGNCSAGGYDDGSNAFVVNEVNGTWRTVVQVSGTPLPSDVESVSCAAAGECSAGGLYTAPPLHEYGRGFVLSSS